MGLDITAFQFVEFVADYNADKGYDNDYEDHELLVNCEDFKERNGSLKNGYYCASGIKHGFRAGSYSGYNFWRDWLTRLVDKTPEYIWKNDALPEVKALPFFELISFTDCDGFLGPEICAKLAKDFAAFAEKVGKSGYDARIYQEFRTAFELAAGHGAVVFH